MLHGGRESDSFRVPRQPSNKGRLTGPAEKGEGRELAKGTVAEPTRSWTQRRGLLSPELSRDGRRLRVPARHHPRQEPGAVVPHAGICAGGAG